MPNSVPTRISGHAPGITDADYRRMVEGVRDYAIFMLDPRALARRM